jgi:cytochrome b/b6/petB-like protein
VSRAARFSSRSSRHERREWLEDRTGYRAALRHLLDEPLPNGAGWLFTTGSVVLFLLVVLLPTGVVLAMYYVPTPSLAHDSVRYISGELAYGSIVRGLHFWGAELHRGVCRDSSGAGVPARILQGARRGNLDHGRLSAARSVGSRRDATSIEESLRTRRPSFPMRSCRPFGERLSAEQIDVVVRYLAARQ